jgi:hypothetical protein
LKEDIIPEFATSCMMCKHWGAAGVGVGSIYWCSIHKTQTRMSNKCGSFERDPNATVEVIMTPIPNETNVFRAEEKYKKKLIGAVGGDWEITNKYLYHIEMA